MRRFKASDGTILEYFTEQRRIAKYFSPPMDNYETNYYIIKQLPSRAREVLAVIDNSNTESISQALGRLDASYKENIEIKSIANNNQKYNTSGYRGSVPQSHQKPTVNYIQETRRDESRRMPYGNFHYNNSADHGRNRRAPQENWRGESVPKYSNDFCFPDISRPPPHHLNSLVQQEIDVEPEHQSNKKNIEPPSVNTIRALHRSEFVRELCWDVEGNEGSLKGEKDSRVISPRIQAVVYSRPVSMLLDSGSEITCISEMYYTGLKKK